MAQADDARNEIRSGRHAATPSGGNPPDSDLRSVANQIEGLLDDDGHYNPEGTVSRNHPDYDPDNDYLRSWDRGSEDADKGFPVVGFRCVRSP